MAVFSFSENCFIFQLKLALCALERQQVEEW